MTAAIVIAGGLLLGAGLVVSQLVRLRTWLGEAPPTEPTEAPPGQTPTDSPE